MGKEDAVGNVDRKQGSLFRLDGAKVTKVADHIDISNGLAWDLRQKAMYYTDSLERNIRRYDYDVDTGEICEFIYFFHTSCQKKMSDNKDHK